MQNNDEVIQNKIIQDSVLDNVVGGAVRTGVPRNEGNMREVTKKQLDDAWERVKEKMGWKFKERELNQKDRELELKAKQMWIDAGFKVTDLITGFFK